MKKCSRSFAWPTDWGVLAGVHPRNASGVRYTFNGYSRFLGINENYERVVSSLKWHLSGHSNEVCSQTVLRHFMRITTLQFTTFDFLN